MVGAEWRRGTLGAGAFTPVVPRFRFTRSAENETERSEAESILYQQALEIRLLVEAGRIANEIPTERTSEPPSVAPFPLWGE
jgi:hypothetical protein